jgi:hypothetical protein
MPLHYVIDDDVLHLKLEGEYDPREVIELFLAAMNDSACPNPVYLVVDATESLSLSTRSSDQIRRIAEFIGPYADRLHHKCAVVAATQLDFGLSRVGCAYSTAAGVQAAAFMSVEQAIDWLKDLPPSAITS